jgi:diguanylate cyclase (GGDEF)-like protein
MRLKNKALLVIGLTGFIFLPSIVILPLKFIYIASLFALSYATLFLMIHLLIIKRAENLNRDVKDIVNEETLGKRISTVGNDELSIISSNFNALLSMIEKMKASHQITENQTKAHVDELLEKNIHFQQEISVLSRSEKIQIDLEYLKQLGRNDALTSLPNGIHFNEILNKAITYSQRRNQNLALLLVDLDLFKLVDETFGKEKSDLVLKEIGKRFTNILRKEDVLAKLEGDEFAVLLNDIGKPKFASMVAEKLLRICSQLLKLDTHEFTLTASIGISVFPNDGLSLEDLFQNADRALFKAKQAGGNTYRFFTEDLQIEALE